MRMRARYVCVEHASARGVADRWRAQYECNGKWAASLNGNSEVTYNQLCALGKQPDIAKVAEIIGNKSWSYLSCDGCDDHVEAAIRIGENRYDDAKVYCVTCVREAAAVLSELE